MAYVSRFSLVAVAAGLLAMGSSTLTAQPNRQASVTGTSAAAGYWQGTNTASRLPGRQIPTAFVFNQSGTNVTGGYVTASGVYGTGSGSFNGNTGTVTWTNNAPQCPGTYTNSYQLSGNTIRWTYSGRDCLGQETGGGQATRIPISSPRRARR